MQLLEAMIRCLSDAHVGFFLFYYYSTIYSILTYSSTHYSIFGNIFDGHQTLLPDTYTFMNTSLAGVIYGVWSLSLNAN